MLLVPGALTGAGSVTVLIAGGMVAAVLGYMGVSQVRVAAIVFIIAGLSAAAPPVSLWAMMTAAGVNMPYVGLLLAAARAVRPRRALHQFPAGLEGHDDRHRQGDGRLPEAPRAWRGGRCWSPSSVFLALVWMGRQWPHSTPIVGLPLMFAASALVSWAMSPRG